MKNLFLCSHFSSVAKLYQNLEGQQLKGKSVVFIPTASNCEKVTLPHHTNFPFKKAVETVLSKYEKILDLYPVSNKQAITIVGERVQVLTK